MEELLRTHIGNLLKESRETQSLSPADVGALLGVPETIVNELEQGHLGSVCRETLREVYGLGCSSFDQYFLATHDVKTFVNSAGNTFEHIAPKPATKPVVKPESTYVDRSSRERRVSYFETPKFLL